MRGSQHDGRRPCTRAARTGAATDNSSAAADRCQRIRSVDAAAAATATTTTFAGAAAAANSNAECSEPSACQLGASRQHPRLQSQQTEEGGGQRSQQRLRATIVRPSCTCGRQHDGTARRRLSAQEHRGRCYWPRYRCRGSRVSAAQGSLSSTTRPSTEPAQEPLKRSPAACTARVGAATACTARVGAATAGVATAYAACTGAAADHERFRRIGSVAAAAAAAATADGATAANSNAECSETSSCQLGAPRQHPRLQGGWAEEGEQARAQHRGRRREGPSRSSRGRHGRYDGAAPSWGGAEEGLHAHPPPCGQRSRGRGRGHVTVSGHPPPERNSPHAACRSTAAPRPSGGKAGEAAGEGRGEGGGRGRGRRRR